MLGVLWLQSLLVLMSCQHIQGQLFQLWRGGSNDGLLRVNFNNSYSIACSNSRAFSTDEANILCRGLNKAYGKSILTDYKHYLVGNETLETVDPVMFEFRCKGTESSFSQCVNQSSIKPPSNVPCISAIGVMCSDQDPTFRLSSTITNRIEMSVNSTWAGICAEHFTRVEAVVACMTLKKQW